MAEDNKPRFFYGYIVVAAILVIMVMIWGTVSTFGVFFGSLIEEFGWTRALTAGASSVRDVLFGLFCIVTARLCDRFSPRIVITFCGFLLGLGYLLMSQVNAVWQLYMSFGVVIAMGMSSYTSMLSIVARWFERRRGLMTGIVLSGMGLSNMIMPPIASWLISVYDWRTSYIIIGIVSFAFVVPAVQFLRRAPDETGQLSPAKVVSNEGGHIPDRKGLSFQQAIKTREFWLVCILYFFFLFCLLTILVHIVIHATGLGISANISANILSIIGVLNIISMIITGNTADRIGNKLTLAISFILMAMSFFWLITAREIWTLYLFAGIFGLAYGGMQVLFSPLTAELFGLRSHGVILSTAAFAGTVGAAIGPVIAGHIFDTTSSYYMAFLTCAIIAVTGVILTYLLRQVQSKERWR